MKILSPSVAVALAAVLAALAVGCGEDPEPPTEAEVRTFLLDTGQVEEGIDPSTDTETLVVTTGGECYIDEIIVDPARVEAESEFGGIVNADETFALASNGGADNLTGCDQAVRDLIADY